MSVVNSVAGRKPSPVSAGQAMAHFTLVAQHVAMRAARYCRSLTTRRGAHMLVKKARTVWRRLRRSPAHELFWRTRRRIRFLLREPATLNEKIQYRMIFDRRDVLTQLVDKYHVRSYVTERLGVGHLPELYAVAESPDAIDWAALPPRFVLKATHGCGATILVDERADPNVQLPSFDPRRPWGVTARIHPRQFIRTEGAAVLMEAWLAANYWRYHGITEWAYKNVTPRIIIEELLDAGDGRTPADHKLWCVNGRVMFLTVDDRNGRATRSVHLPDWSATGAHSVVDEFALPSVLPPSPANLLDLIGVAERLSADLDFLRVDLYNINGSVIVGELTVYPTGGTGRYAPQSFFDDAVRDWKPTTVVRST